MPEAEHPGGRAAEDDSMWGQVGRGGERRTTKRRKRGEEEGRGGGAGGERPVQILNIECRNSTITYKNHDAVDKIEI